MFPAESYRIHNRERPSARTVSSRNAVTAERIRMLNKDRWNTNSFQAPVRDNTSVSRSVSCGSGQLTAAVGRRPRERTHSVQPSGRRRADPPQTPGRGHAAANQRRAAVTRIGGHTIRTEATGGLVEYGAKDQCGFSWDETYVDDSWGGQRLLVVPATRKPRRTDIAKQEGKNEDNRRRQSNQGKVNPSWNSSKVEQEIIEEHQKKLEQIIQEQYGKKSVHVKQIGEFGSLKQTTSATPFSFASSCVGGTANRGPVNPSNVNGNPPLVSVRGAGGAHFHARQAAITKPLRNGCGTRNAAGSLPATEIQGARTADVRRRIPPRPEAATAPSMETQNQDSDERSQLAPYEPQDISTTEPLSVSVQRSPGSLEQNDFGESQVSCDESRPAGISRRPRLLEKLVEHSETTQVTPRTIPRAKSGKEDQVKVLVSSQSNGKRTDIDRLPSRSDSVSIGVVSQLPGGKAPRIKSHQQNETPQESQQKGSVGRTTAGPVPLRGPSPVVADNFRQPHRLSAKSKGLPEQKTISRKTSLFEGISRSCTAEPWRPTQLEDVRCSIDGRKSNGLKEGSPRKPREVHREVLTPDTVSLLEHLQNSKSLSLPNYSNLSCANTSPTTGTRRQESFIFRSLPALLSEDDGDL